jgi:hypothetical protein
MFANSIFSSRYSLPPLRAGEVPRRGGGGGMKQLQSFYIMDLAGLSARLIIELAWRMARRARIPNLTFSGWRRDGSVPPPPPFGHLPRRGGRGLML